MHNELGTYDCIIAGGGLSGLALATGMARSAKLRGLKVLMIERENKTENDRTWCFWEAGAGPFEQAVAQQWNALIFKGPTFNKRFDIAPYAYKIIKSSDFYAHCRQELANTSFETIQANISAIRQQHSGAAVVTDKGVYAAKYVFNSALRPDTTGSRTLLQHFKGYTVHTNRPVFDSASPTLMDFSTPQEGDFRFFYVIPFSPSRALVEYTVFSENLLTEEQYEQKLRERLTQLAPEGYTVEEGEWGIIPMSDFKFRQREGAVFHLGTAGGRTKASTGYTFVNVVKHTEALIAYWEKYGKPGLKKNMFSKRFYWYDRLLINVLATNKYPGDRLMSELFRKNPPQRMLSFLREDTTFWQELNIMWSTPTWVFTRALIQEIFLLLKFKK